VLDAKVCGETGSDGIQEVVLEARGRPDASTSFLAFDVLVPVAEDATHLWVLWVGQGGEGIVFKNRRVPYTPGPRSRAWLKVKHRLTLRARVLDGESELVR